MCASARLGLGSRSGSAGAREGKGKALGRGQECQRRRAHRAREREHEQMLVERSVLEPSLAQPSGKVGPRVSRHVAFAMLLEQLLLALRLDGLPVDLHRVAGLRACIRSHQMQPDGGSRMLGGERREHKGQVGKRRGRGSRTFMIEAFLAGAVGGLVDSASQSLSIWCGAGAAMPAKSVRRRRALRQSARTVVRAARAFISWTAWPQALHGQQHRP